MSSSQRRALAQAMKAVPLPVERCVALDAGVLEDVAARYGVTVGPEARAVRVPTGVVGRVVHVTPAGAVVMLPVQLQIEGEA